MARSGDADGQRHHVPAVRDRKHALVAALLQCIPLLAPAFFVLWQIAPSSRDVHRLGELVVLATLIAGWGWGYVYLGHWRRYGATVALAGACWLVAGTGVVIAFLTYPFNDYPVDLPGFIPYVLLVVVPGPLLALGTAIDAWRQARARLAPKPG